MREECREGGTDREMRMRRGSREGRISEDSRKESGELLKMKGSRGEERAERKQRRKSHLGQ